jgi:hypothetical protein
LRILSRIRENFLPDVVEVNIAYAHFQCGYGRAKVRSFDPSGFRKFDYGLPPQNRKEVEFNQYRKLVDFIITLEILRMVISLYRRFALLGLVAVVAVGIQCAGTGFGPGGSIMTSTKIGVHAAPEGTLTGSKEGKACVSSILGIISTGDASILEVTGDAGISTVKTIDLEGYSILGLYSELCTVVTGD